jgi:hypothetical protein
MDAWIQTLLEKKMDPSYRSLPLLGLVLDVALARQQEKVDDVLVAQKVSYSQTSCILCIVIDMLILDIQPSPKYLR